MTVGLPILCYVFSFVCNDVTGCPAPSLLSPNKLFTAPTLSTQSGWEHGIDTLKREVGWPGVAGLLNTKAFLGTLSWYALSLVLYALLPAYEVDGAELRSGGRLKYRLNSTRRIAQQYIYAPLMKSAAFFTFVALVVTCAAGTFVRGADFEVWTFITNNYVQILTSNIIISYALATYVYVKSFSVKQGNRDKRELAAGGHSGNVLYDWFIGRELNPRVTLPLFGEVDIKSFMEMRPGLIGWVLLDFAFMAKQYRSYGYVTDSMSLSIFSLVVFKPY